MTAGMCLPPGTYNIDPPPLVGGRRRVAMLTGGTLCGVRDDVLVRFRGDTAMQAYVGVADADIHNAQLDGSCLYNTHEQTHLIRIMTSGHSIRDVKLSHPKWAITVGDSINVLAPVIASPIEGPIIDHVEFASCARFAVQITRGVHDNGVSNSTFSGDCGIGSEGGGNISGMTFDHLTFDAPATPGNHVPALSIQNMTDTIIDHVSLHGRTILLYNCERVTLQHSSVGDLVATNSNADWVSALSISTVAHDITVSDAHLIQSTVASVPVIAIGPVRANYQADLSNITITASDLYQETGSPVVSAQGVNTLTLSNSTLHLNSPSVTLVSVASVATSPAVSMPALNTTESGNVSLPYP